MMKLTVQPTDVASQSRADSACRGSLSYTVMDLRPVCTTRVPCWRPAWTRVVCTGH